MVYTPRLKGINELVRPLMEEAIEMGLYIQMQDYQFMLLIKEVLKEKRLEIELEEYDGE